MNTLDRVRHTVVDTDVEISLLEFLRDKIGLSESRAHELLDLGAIYVDKKRTFVDQRLKPGAYVRAHVDPRRYPAHLFQIERHIIYQNDDFIIVDKPHGLPVHPTLDNYRENIVDLLRHFTRHEFYVTQRLDVGTRGLFLLAKNEKFQSHFNRELRAGRPQKHYHCLTEGPVPLGPLIHYMKPGDRAPKELQKQADESWQRCELNVLESVPFDICHPHAKLFNEFTPRISGLLWISRIQLLTGRTHQIRTQLAHEGLPIVGDVQYQNPSAYIPWKVEHEKFALICTTLGFFDLQNANQSFELERIGSFTSEAKT